MNLQERTPNAKVKRPQHGLQMIYNYSRCVGMWPFTITYDSKRAIKEAHIDPFDWLWFLVSISLYLAALFYSYKNAWGKLPSNADFFFWHLIHAISEVPTFFFGAVGIVLDMLNRNILVNILKSIIAFDSGVSFKNE